MLGNSLASESPFVVGLHPDVIDEAVTQIIGITDTESDYLRGNRARARCCVIVRVMSATQPVGHLLREWRQRRRMSQLDFATEAEISSKHLSFLETGRSQPSREMLLRLADLLEVPLRERNAMLIAAGFAPMFAERSLSDPALKAAREAVELVLKGHEPYPALAIDRHWTMLAANSAVTVLLGDVDPELLKPPVNVLRLSLHPNGLAPRIANLAQWREHLFARLKRQIDVSADQVLIALLDELAKYPAPAANAREAHIEADAIIVPFKLVVNGAVLSFISTTTVFGTPIDVTLSELALESFFPADEATAAIVRGVGN
jgi:transcriptional regulator with XRE-family HTH domain